MTMRLLYEYQERYNEDIWPSGYIIQTYQDYLDARKKRLEIKDYNNWRKKIAIEDTRIRRDREAKENVIIIIKAKDKTERKRYYIPKEQKYIGEEGMDYIFGIRTM